MNIATVRTGIETRLNTIGVRVYTTIPEQVTTPAAIVQVGDGEFIVFDDTFSAAGVVSYTLNMKILVITGRAAIKTAQDLLDDFCSPDSANSIRKAIGGDTTLNSSADNCRVTGVSSFGVYTFSSIEYLGAEFLIEILG